jgi:type IV pilus biogenesis protein CpaD/CtpE
VAFNPLEWLKFARTIDRLLTLETKHTALIEAQAKEIQALKDRVTKLEAREEILIAEARGAAAAAASAVASQHVADIARRVGALDERTRQLRSLPAPDPERP